MKPQYVLAALLLFPAWAHAEIYKSIDKDGHVTYSSTPMKGGKKLNLEPLPTIAPPPRATKSPEDFPRVNRETQKNRDDMRSKILRDELAAEEKLLAEAKQNLDDASPEVFRGADGKTYRNVAKYEEKVKELNNQVGLHEQNISALKAELSKLKQ